MTKRTFYLVLPSWKKSTDPITSDLATNTLTELLLTMQALKCTKKQNVSSLHWIITLFLFLAQLQAQ